MAESVFTFNDVPAGTALPFALSVNGLTATFSGNAAVCPTTGLSGNMFASLTGNALVQGFCQPSASSSSPITLAFSSSLSKLTFNVAVNGTVAVPVSVTFFQNGTAVGSQLVQTTIPNGSVSPEATVSYAGSFNSVLVVSAGLLAVGNVDAVPVGTP